MSEFKIDAVGSYRQRDGGRAAARQCRSSGHCGGGEEMSNAGYSQVYDKDSGKILWQKLDKDVSSEN